MIFKGQGLGRRQLVLFQKTAECPEARISQKIVRNLRETGLREKSIILATGRHGRPQQPNPNPNLNPLDWSLYGQLGNLLIR